MIADDSDVVGMKYIKELAQLGYDYVELPLAQIMDLSDCNFDILMNGNKIKYHVNAATTSFQKN